LLVDDVNTGFIGAACGQLDAVLQSSSIVDNGLSKGVGSEISAVNKAYKNITATKTAAYRTEYIYGSCNGLHF